MKSFSSEELSVGGAKILRAFTQYPIRVLEQCIHSHYKPYLNPTTNSIIFFNFNFDPHDMNLASESLHRYQALASDKITVLAECDSFNSLGKAINVSNVSVRNNMN